MSNNKYKILIVEDDPNISSFIQTMLEANGYQVLCAMRCQQCFQSGLMADKLKYEAPADAQ